ncbi:putative BTB/Kelch-associated [Helianthus anomalus]
MYYISFFEYGRFERSLVGFPLNNIEAIISSNVLEVRTEDVVYNFLCKWAKAKYSQSQRYVRRAVVSQLASHLWFYYMNVETL